MTLTAEELLAGSRLSHDVVVPPELLGAGVGEEGAASVCLRPLTVDDLQRVSRAAKQDDQLTATLLVHAAIEAPALSIAQVAGLSAGLAQFLVDRVNEISGITASQEHLTAAMEAPLVKAAFVLSRQLGWTPEEIHALTLGQILLHLQLLRQGSAVA